MAKLIAFLLFHLVHGFCDLIYNSIDGFRRHPSENILTCLGSRDAYMCARCHCVLPPTTQTGVYLAASGRCRCARLGLLPALTVISPNRVIYGLRSGARSFSASALWSTLELSAQGVRAVQSLFEVSSPFYGNLRFQFKSNRQVHSPVKLDAH